MKRRKPEKQACVSWEGDYIVFRGRRGRMLLARLNRIANAKGKTVQWLLKEALKEAIHEVQVRVAMPKLCWDRLAQMAKERGVTQDEVMAQLIEVDHKRWLIRGKGAK